MLDLSHLPVVDDHCHAVDREHPADLADWRSRFTESPDPGMRAHDAADTAFYRRLLHALEELHGVTGEEAVLQARSAQSPLELTGRLLRAERVAGLVVDTGYPPAGQALPRDQVVSATGAQQRDLLRLELLFQDLVARYETLDETVAAVREALDDLRGKGSAGLKSVVGYRTGLHVQRWEDDAVASAFVAARQEVAQSGAVRLGHQPLLDTLLHVALGQAAAQELPVQFHVGYGDPDVDLRAANPLHLRDVLEDPAYRSVPVVLLHSCWPYAREGAFLAAVYPNAHLDLSFAIPYLSLREMTSAARAAVATAPFSKLLYASDGARVPELHWLGARDGRRALGTVLGELVDDGELTHDEAQDAAARVLGGNAWRLYGFDGTLA